MLKKINKKRSETMKKRWAEGRFKNRILKGIPHPWNKNKQGTYKIGHKQSEVVKKKVSKTRINNCVAKGEKNPAWIDGRSRRKYPTEYYKIRQKILKKYKHKCLLCNKKFKDEKREMKCKNFITVHHIDYDKFNNSEENLITLCNVCNVFVNKDRNQWIKFFKEKLNG